MRLAESCGDEVVRRQCGLFERDTQCVDRVVEPFIRELPRAIVKAEAAVGLEVEVGLDGFGWVHVHGAHF